MAGYNDLEHLTLTGVKISDRVIGSGAYGRILQADYYGTLCAAKILAQFGRNFTKQQFIQNCLLRCQLDHPNIVKMLGLFHLQASSVSPPVQVMELMEYNLTALLYQSQDIPMYVKLSILQDVSRGVQYLHGLSPPLIHRNLFSKYVLLSNTLVAKLSHFRTAQEKQHVSSIPVNVAFMAPEVVGKNPVYGLAADVFSFGCVVCHVITQQWPQPYYRQGVVTHGKEVGLRRHYVDQINDGSLKRLVITCLDDDPERRPQITQVCGKITSIVAGHYAKDATIKMAYSLAMKEGVAESRDLQVLLVGAENTGKTCLISSFLGEQFIEEQAATETVEVDVCKIYCKDWTRISHSDKTDILHHQFVDQLRGRVVEEMMPIKSTAHANAIVSSEAVVLSSATKTKHSIAAVNYTTSIEKSYRDKTISTASTSMAISSEDAAHPFRSVEVSSRDAVHHIKSVGNSSEAIVNPNASLEKFSNGKVHPTTLSRQSPGDASHPNTSVGKALEQKDTASIEKSGNVVPIIGQSSENKAATEMHLQEPLDCTPPSNSSVGVYTATPHAVTTEKTLETATLPSTSENLSSEFVLPQIAPAVQPCESEVLPHTSVGKSPDFPAPQTTPPVNFSKNTVLSSKTARKLPKDMVASRISVGECSGEVSSPYLPAASNNADISGENLLQSHLQNMQEVPSKTSQYDPDSLNLALWDFPGQVIFHNTHSVFISESGIVTITFNASLQLTGEVMPREGSPTPAECCTIISSIHYWLQVVDSMCSIEGKEGDLSPLQPAVILAGTHIDKLHIDITVARKIAKEMILPQLIEELSDKRYAQHLVGMNEGIEAALEQFCFFISNKIRDEEIERLKSTAITAATSLRKRQPIYFLKIERALLQHDEQVISKSTMAEVVAESTFPIAENSSEFDGVLKYFHEKRVILYFSQIKSLQDLVILSPRWLARLFSYIITAYSYKRGKGFDEAWKRLTKYGILHESLLQHMLDKFHSDYPSEMKVSKRQVVDILLCFHLVARITREAWFSEEGYPSLPDTGDTFIVPSLIPRDDKKNPPNSKQERIVYFKFISGFIPTSLLNQLIADCICRNVERNSRLLWMRHGKVGLQLGADQKYYISRCEEKQSIQLTITMPMKDDVNCGEDRRELIDDIIRLLDDIMKVFMPAVKKRPVLLVPCPKCPTLHITFDDVCKGGTIFCTASGDSELLRGYYDDLLPQGSCDPATLPGADRKSEVFTKYYGRLATAVPFKELSPNLVSARIITNEENQIIQNTLEMSKTASLVLDKIDSSLKALLTNKFDEFLAILEDYDDLCCAELANQMKRELSQTPTAGKPSHDEEDKIKTKPATGTRRRRRRCSII